MELLKLPAGRLATVFYKNEPQESQSLAMETFLESSNTEKASSEETLPPLIEKASRRSAKQVQMETKRHAFAWKNLTLDLKLGDGKQRLLENVDGKSLGTSDHLFRLTLVAGWVTPGQMTALMGVSGAGKVQTKSPLL